MQTETVRVSLNLQSQVRLERDVFHLEPSLQSRSQVMHRPFIRSRDLDIVDKDQDDDVGRCVGEAALVAVETVKAQVGECSTDAFKSQIEGLG